MQVQNKARTVYYFTALHSCSAKFRYGNKCWSAWSKPNWNSLAQTLEPEYDPGEVTGGLWGGPISDLRPTGVTEQE